MLKTVFSGVATSPAVAFGAGNLVWAWETAEISGIILNALVLAATTAMQIRDSATGKKTGMPFYVIAGVNAWTAGSVLYEGASHVGASELFDVLSKPEARKYTLSALAYAGWSAAHFARGFHDKFGKNAIGSQQLHAGYADIAMIQADTPKDFNIALIPIAAGFMKSLFDRKESTGPVSTRTDFARKHVTPNRLYTAAYLMGAAAAVNPAYALAQAIWSYGYALFDGKQNKEIAADAKRTFQP